MPLSGSNITFNPQTRTASSQKNCIEYLGSDTGCKITVIQNIYRFHNNRFIYSPTEIHVQSIINISIKLTLQIIVMKKVTSDVYLNN